MTKKDIHVVPHNDGWAVREEGEEWVLITYARKKEAEEFGRSIAKAHGVELVIHGLDGRIQDSDSYGNDPFPARDKKR